LQQGLGAMSGVLSLILAKKGFTGAKNIFEGQYGLYSLYFRGVFNRKALIDELGERFEGTNVSIKPYPCCRYTHAPIHTTIEIVKRYDIKIEKIKEIRIGTSSYGYKLVGEGNTKYYPQNPVDAQFSIPYTVSTGLIKGDVFIGDFTEKAIRTPKILALAQKVKTVVDPNIDKINAVVTPSRVDIETNDGRHYSEYVEFAKGHPKNPMSWPECIEKFRKCNSFSANPLPQVNIDRIIDMIDRLEQVDDVTKIIRLLEPFGS
jgi:2-methylcitrate dehydratase PrpD